MSARTPGKARKPRGPSTAVHPRHGHSSGDRFEQELRQRTEELEKLMDMIPSAIWVSRDPRCRVITGNRAANRFYEAAHGENVSANPARRPEPGRRRFFQKGTEIKACALPMQMAAARGIEIRDYEVDVRLPSGRMITILGNATPLRDAEGRVRGAIASFVDITARKQAEAALRELAATLEQRVAGRTAELQRLNEALRESEERFRQMAENVEEVFWLADARMTRMLYVSPAFERIWGRPCAELHAHPRAWIEAVHPADRDRVRAVFIKDRHGGEPMQADYRIVRPDGTVRWISDRGSVVRDGRGRVYRVAGVARDITERRQMEERHIKATEAERERLGSDLHDELGQSLPAIGYMIGAVRQRLVRRGAPEAAELEKISTLIARDARRVHEMSRGLFPMELREGGIADALRELADSAEEVYGVPCQVSGLKGAGLVDAAVARPLYRIAQEAVHNAVRHSGCGRIRLDLARRGGRIVLTVSDNGRGFALRPKRANGMGLRLMRYRADLIGAVLEIRSRRGQGTTVRCLAPRTNNTHAKEDGS